MNQAKRLNKINHILSRIRNIFLNLEFIPKIVSNEYRDEINYVFGDLYCIPQYKNGLGFFIEYAHSHEEAKKHFHGDGDMFPLKMGEDVILAEIEKEIRQNMERAIGK